MSKRIKPQRDEIERRNSYVGWAALGLSDPTPLRAGTVWVPRGEGSTWRELRMAFGTPIHPEINTVALAQRTNLKLTGNALTDEDRGRWESGHIS